MRMGKRGFTVLEVMVAAGAFSMVFVGGYTMLNTASSSFDRNRAQSDADVDAVMAMQHIINDLREAKSFTIENGGPNGRITITYPIEEGSGFDRFIPDPDPDNQVTYYLENRSLWREKPSDGTGPVRVRWGINDEWTPGEDPNDPATWTNESGIESLRFESDSPLSVKITIKTSVRRQIATPDPETLEPTRVPQTTELTERLVYLRNW